MSDFTYLGIDETTLAIGRGLVIVATYTSNKALTQTCQLEKAGDLLKKGNFRDELFPSLVEMYNTGLDGFHWMRANKGRFNRQQIQHAAISNLIAANGFEPQKTVVLIDNFYGNGQKTEEMIFEYLQRKGFRIPRQNIECHAGGDTTIPIINYADLLAFQIAVGIRRKYSEYFPNATNFPIKIQEIPYDENRVQVLTEENRLTLETVINMVN